MGQTLTLKVKGLQTNPNSLDPNLVDGALAVADNIVIDQDNLGASRRGFEKYGQYINLGTYDKQVNSMFNYQGKLLINYDSKIAKDPEAQEAWIEYNGSFDVPDTDYKIRGIEENQNLYICTDTGVKRLDNVDFEFEQAGIVTSLDGFGSATGSGWFPAGTTVAYRMVWVKEDANNNLLIGAPSSRVIIANTSGVDANAKITFLIPDGVTTSYKYQIYRSSTTEAVTDTPDDEMQLVIEGSPTTAQISAKEFIVIDTLPSELRGVTLYTSPSQQGIANANFEPPFCKDMASYKDHLVFANVKVKHYVNIQLLGTGSTGFNVGDTIVIDDIVYTGANAENVANNEFKVYDTSAPAQDIQDTAFSLVKIINKTTENVTVYAFYASDFEDIPGKIRLEARSLGGLSFAVYSSKGSAWTPELPAYGGYFYEPIAFVNMYSNFYNVLVKWVSTGSPNLTFNSMTYYSFATLHTALVAYNVNFGYIYKLLPDGTMRVPFGQTLVTVNSGVTQSNVGYYLTPPGTEGLDYDDSFVRFRRQDNVVDKVIDTFAYGSEDAIYFSKTGTQYTLNLEYGFDTMLPYSTKNDARVNRLFFSKQSQPDAVPLYSFIDVGSANQPIKRVIALRDSVFIFKDDGIFRLTGETFSSFSVALFDNSTRLLAPETAVPLNNTVFAMTLQGVVSVADTGVAVLSRAIESDLLRMIQYPAFNSKSFAIAYESDRKYILFTPYSATQEFPTSAYCYNTFTNAWTRWIFDATAGLVKADDDKLYLAGKIAGYPQCFIYKERKTFTLTDYADDSWGVQILGVSHDAKYTYLDLNRSQDLVEGYGITQLNPSTGVRLTGTIVDIVIDPNNSIPPYVVVEPKSTLWTSDPTYPTEIVKPINCRLKWVANTAQNPGQLKHFRDATVFFKQDTYAKLNIGFETNYQPGYASVPVTTLDVGDWGNFDWGTIPWNGVDETFNQATRVGIPRQKQKCLWMNFSVQSATSFTSFSVAGISTSFEMLSERLTPNSRQ